jgi:hypothetical protein
MEITMELDELALRAACLKTAENALWNMKPFNAAPITSLADSYFEIAYEYLKTYCKDRDPNIAVRAVYYLAQITVPSGENTTWFENSLLVLLELACPNTLHDEESIEFLKDIEEGIAEVKIWALDGL